MGMIGCYFTIDNTLMQQVIEGETSLNDLNPHDYPNLDIDKSWEGIHYLLCKDISDGEPPLSYVVPLITDQHLDYGSFGAFYLRAGQVAEAYQAIAELDEAQLRLQFDFQKMIEEEIYPFSADEDENELFEYLLQNFNEIKRFYSQTAAEGKGVIFYIF
ncbi:YfbM family protein [Paenibacillus gorillae]|uniref:YfbM family protein n=1 Tax=Paenibacillus gorillae TaxID=1243662 RepID=UPI0004B4C26E|nr:YfbM family protein [Paenibacillus gorillae]